MSHSLLAGAVIVYFIIILAAVAFGIFLLWRIFSKAGYNGAMSLLILIPGIGSLIVVLILAFGDWPVLRELNMLRQQRGMMPPGPGYPQGPYAPNPQYPPASQYPSGPQYPPSNPQYPPSGPQYPPSGPQYPQM